MKRLLSLLLSAAMTLSLLPAALAAEEDVVYGTMNIPYADFYKGEGVEAVDAVTSATQNKWKATDGLAKGTFNQPGENGGGQILGVVYPVAISSADLTALGENNYGFTALEEPPAAYKTVTVSGGTATFSAVQGATTALSDASAVLADSSRYGDYQVSVAGTTYSNGDVAGVLLTTSDNKVYALRHLENIWKAGAELAWSVGFKTTEGHGNALNYANYQDMQGKTITRISYITRDGIAAVDTNLYVPVKFEGSVAVADALNTAGRTTVNVEGLPEDYAPEYTVAGLENAAVNGNMMTYANTAAKGAYTLVITDRNQKYASLSASFELKTADMPAAFDLTKNAVVAVNGVNAEGLKEYLSSINAVTVDDRNYIASGKHAVKIVQEDGSFDLTAAGMTESKDYEVVIKATGYQDLAFTWNPDVAYGTMNFTYADFYKAEGVAYDVDAVTSATASKWKMNGAGQLCAGTFYEAAEVGGKILGVAYPVRLSKADLTALGENNNGFAAASKTDAYKEVTVADGTAAFSAVKGETKALEGGAVSSFTTSSRYGDYQMSVDGTIPSPVGGVLLTTKEGKVYGLRHLENIWRGGAQLAWSTGFTTVEGHGNALSYENFADMMGQTITKVTYITRDGIYTVDTDTYVPIKVTADVSVADALPNAGSTKVTVENLPADFDAQYTVSLEGASVSGDTMTLPADAAKGAYTLTVTDKGGKYADLTATFYLGDVVPALFDAEKKAVVPAEGVSDEAFKAYLAAISSVSVNGKSYAASGRRAVTIVNPETGAFDLTAAGMTEKKAYDVVIAATDYQSLTFTEDYRAEQTITVADSFKKTYGDKAFKLGAAATGELTYESDNTKVATVSKAGKVTIKGAGTANITITAAGTEDLAEATKTVKVTVAKGAQTIKVSKTKVTKVVGDKAFKLGATLTGDGALAYKTSNKKVATVKNGKVTLVGAGVAKITVSAKATTNSKAAKNVTVTVTVNPKAVKISKATAKKKNVTVTWKVNNKKDTYEIQYAAKKNFKGAKTVKAKKAAKTAVIKNLKKGTYYVRVRAVQNKCASAWSAGKTVKVK